MTEKKTSQSQNKENPMSIATQMAEEAYTRMNGLFDEMAKLETRGVDQLTRAMEEYGRVVKAQIALTQQMTTAWRQVTMETTRRAIDLATPSASA